MKRLLRYGMLEYSKQMTFVDYQIGVQRKGDFMLHVPHTSGRDCFKMYLLFDRLCQWKGRFLIQGCTSSFRVLCVLWFQWCLIKTSGFLLSFRGHDRKAPVK